MSYSFPSPQYESDNLKMVCVNGKTVKDLPVNQLPCCSLYRPRTRWVNSILPPIQEDPQLVANQFPFWGLWRTQDSPPLPHVFYPNSIRARGTYDS